MRKEFLLVLFLALPDGIFHKSWTRTLILLCSFHNCAAMRASNVLIFVCHGSHLSARVRLIPCMKINNRIINDYESFEPCFVGNGLIVTAECINLGEPAQFTQADI